MDLNLAGKTALITGASRGIGASIAQELAREGVHVCLAARDTAKLDEVARQHRGDFGQQRRTAVHRRRPAAAGRGDRPRSTPRSRRSADSTCLVNNAGATKRADFFTLTEEDLQGGFALKFHGYVRSTRAAWPYLREAQRQYHEHRRGWCPCRLR